jgi:hypothetical protein
VANVKTELHRLRIVLQAAGRDSEQANALVDLKTGEEGTGYFKDRHGIVNPRDQ